MSDASLRAQTESGEVLDDPTEDQLGELLDRVERGDEDFVIVERTSDPSGQTYIQYRMDDGTFVVEHRDGGPDRHFGATTTEKPIVRDVVAAWAFQRAGWRDLLTWERLEM
jgi:hypothetical protein